MTATDILVFSWAIIIGLLVTLAIALIIVYSQHHQIKSLTATVHAYNTNPLYTQLFKAAAEGISPVIFGQILAFLKGVQPFTPNPDVKALESETEKLVENVEPDPNSEQKAVISADSIQGLLGMFLNHQHSLPDSGQATTSTPAVPPDTTSLPASTAQQPVPQMVNITA